VHHANREMLNYDVVAVEKEGTAQKNAKNDIGKEVATETNAKNCSILNKLVNTGW